MAENKPEAGADSAAPEALAADSPDNLAAQLEQALAEQANLKDQALRAAAEAENVRRRAARDVENAHKFALEKFVGSLLPVLDSLDKAVESSTAHAEDDDQGALSAVAEGVELSRKLMLDTLEKFGVERIDPLGEPFDPQRHEAMSVVEAPDAEPNSVIGVLAPGYMLNGRLVRAAMVMVAKGPAAEQKSIDETV